MYDDLLESQRPSKLEWFVLNTLIPSLFVTSLMHADVVWSIHKPMHAAGEPLGVRGYCFARFAPSVLICSSIADSNSHQSP